MTGITPGLAGDRVGTKFEHLEEAARWWSVFARLPTAHPAIRALAEASQPSAIEAGETLVNEGDDDGAVFLVVSGVLRTVRHTRNGHEVWLADVEPGDITGDMAALTDKPRTSTVVAKAAVSTFIVPRDTFLAIANAHAEFALAVARMLAARLLMTSNHLAAHVTLPVTTRIHGELAMIGTPTADREIFEIRPAPTVTALSARVHATREATSRALGDLEQRGLLKRARGNWKIVVPTTDD